jgi:hypothetical protein
MGSDRSNRRDADDVLMGRRCAGDHRRDQLDDVIAVLHASRELEPPPPMSPRLRAEVYRTVGAGVAPPDTGPSHPPARVVELRPDPPAPVPDAPIGRATTRTARRAAVSVAAAAALLVGVVLAATMPGGDEAAELPSSASSSAGPRATAASSTTSSTGSGHVGAPGPPQSIAPDPSVLEPAATVPPESPTTTSAPAPEGTADDQRSTDGDGEQGPDRSTRQGSDRHQTTTTGEPQVEGADTTSTTAPEAATSTSGATTSSGPEPTDPSTTTTWSDGHRAGDWGSGGSYDNWLFDLFQAFFR